MKNAGARRRTVGAGSVAKVSGGPQGRAAMNVDGWKRSTSSTSVASATIEEGPAAVGCPQIGEVGSAVAPRIAVGWTAVTAPSGALDEAVES